MSFQFNGQLVKIKSQTLPHVAGGASFFAAGADFVTMLPSDNACVAYAAPASPRIIAAETPNFFIAPPPTDSKYHRSPSCAGPTQSPPHYKLVSCSRQAGANRQPAGGGIPILH